jgi:hypothetical protein
VCLGIVQLLPLLLHALQHGYLLLCPLQRKPLAHCCAQAARPWQYQQSRQQQQQLPVLLQLDQRQVACCALVKLLLHACCGCAAGVSTACVTQL